MITANDRIGDRLSGKRPTVAIVHPQILGGGGEAVLAWTIQALKNRYDLTLITVDSVDLNEINSFYSTHLRPGELRLRRVVPFLSKIPGLYLLRRHLVMRYCKAWRSRFDLFFSTQNEMDFGVSGIQYIHFPAHAEYLLRYLGQMPHHWFYQDTGPRRLYRGLLTRLSAYHEEGVRGNLTLTNSSWTAAHIRQAYNLESQIIYPPVLDDFPTTPWLTRENGFVCVGRISPEKEIEKIIAIVREARGRQPDLHLHIVGPIDDKRYAEQIKNLEGNSRWFSLEGAIDRATLRTLIAQHRFGIHGMSGEHFGIGVAEMAKAGCLVFAPNTGGPAEIIGDQRLLYDSPQDAVRKIVHMLSSHDLQNDASNKIIEATRKFSVENFMKSVKKVVAEFLT
jgi:glycosyltransferase involved in cell wall biosynthesis